MPISPLFLPYFSGSNDTVPSLMVAHDDSLFVCAGNTNAGDRRDLMLTECYNIEQDEWTLLASSRFSVNQRCPLYSATIRSSSSVATAGTRTASMRPSRCTTLTLMPGSCPR